MNALFRLLAGVVVLLSLSACAHRYGYYSPHSDYQYYGSGGPSYYGGSSGYYGNYGGYNNGNKHHKHKQYSEYRDRDDYARDRNWNHGNQYSSNYYGQAPNYNNSDYGWKNHKRHHSHRGEGRRERDED